jgi:formylglycine-generating enzyme required for sulfatase activity
MRLCGQIGGGAVADSLASDPTRSQWYLACAGSGSATYPYGNSYNPTICKGVDSPPPAAHEVGAGNCQGHAPGLFDMSGNVFEWIDSCTTALGGNDFCRMMGGGFNSPPDELACDFRALNTRRTTQPNVGFRCCADL